MTVCDSSGLAMFSAVHRRARAGGGWLRIAGPSAALRRSLEMTNLDQVLPVFDSVDHTLDDPAGR